MITDFFKFKKIYSIFSIILCANLLISCRSNTILNSNISISPSDQKELLYAINRYSNNELYESNLAHIVHPNKKELYKEANLTNSEYIERQYKILVDWYENKLPAHNKNKLSQNCSRLVGNFTNYFPLTAKTFPCAGWWLERQKLNRETNAAKNATSTTQKLPTKLNSKSRIEFKNYRNLNFFVLIQNIQFTNFKQLEKLAKAAINNKNICAYKNANFALISNLENFLPNKEAFDYIEKIYHKSAHCYKPDGNLTERINLRFGVLSLIHGKQEQASSAFLKTQKEKDPQENSRSLFWLGLIEYSNKQNLENKYWTRLIHENPLGFFAIVANVRMKKDPQEVFVNDSTITIQNRISGGWNENNLQTFLFDLFYSQHENIALKKLSKSVANNQEISKYLHLYWAINHNIAENDRQSVFMLSKYFSNQKEVRVSKALLNLTFPVRYHNEILQHSKTVDPLLVLALIRQESAFDEIAHSSANARGLMQILPSTARVMDPHVYEKKLYDPNTNVKIGVMYLEKLFDRYQGRTEYVLAAYNAGPQKIDAWMNRVSKVSPLLFMEYIPYKETRNYVSTIMRNYYWYKKLFSEKNDSYSQKFLEKNLTTMWTPNQLIAVFERDNPIAKF